MAAIASTASGDFSVGATWVGGVAPGEGDTCTIENGHIVTIDATITVGDDTATPALDVLNGGDLDWDNGANDVLTLKGDFYVRNGGTLTLDGTGDGTKTLTIKLNFSAALADGKYGLITEDGGIVNCDGFDKTRSWDTLSADAAAGQKVVVTTNDNSTIWNMGDEFVVGSMSREGPTGAETDTIGAFAGGNVITKAGANYNWTHEQNVAFINLTRNVVFTSSNPAFEGYVYVTNNTPGNVDFQWCEFSYLGSNAANKYGVSVVGADYLVAEYCSFHHMYRGIAVISFSVLIHATIDNSVFSINTSRDIDHVDTLMDSVVFLGTSGTGAYSAGDMNFVNSHIGNALYRGIYSSTDVDMDSCRIYGCGTVGAWTTVLVSVLFADSCYFDGNSTTLAQRTGRLVDCNFGVQVANTTDIGAPTVTVGTGINTIALTVSVTGSVYNRVSIEDVLNNHKTWKVAGSYEKQNTVKRTGTYALLMSPTSATDPLIAESTVPASSGVQIVVSAYFRKNASYSGSDWPFLRLSGAGVSAVTDTMTDVDDTWQLLVVSGTPTADGFAKVELVGQNSGAGGAAYVDDVKMVYTVIDTGSMDFWYEGDLPPVLMATGLGAVDVWDVLESQIDTSVANMGRLVLKGLRAIRRQI